MGIEYDPEKLIHIDRQKGLLPNDWKARAMAHEEGNYRAMAAQYRDYLVNDGGVRGKLSQSTDSFFKHLADCGVPPEYIERYGELSAEVNAEIQDFHTETSKQSDIPMLIRQAEGLRKEAKAASMSAAAFLRDNPTARSAPIESAPPEYINANRKSILAALELRTVEARMEELGVPGGEKVSEGEWRAYRDDFREIHRSALRKMLSSSPAVQEWYRREEGAFKEEISRAGFYNDLYMTFHDTLASSTGPERSPYPDYPGEYSLRDSYLRLTKELEAKEKEPSER